MNIRLATLTDVPALKELIHESVSVLSERYYSRTQIATALVHVFGVDTQLILDGTYFVAETENHIAGCGGWSKRKTLFGGDQTKSAKIDALLDTTTDAARIRAFYVHPRWARQGVGAMILKACEYAARSGGFTRVELIATLPGEPFYTAAGYSKLDPFDIQLPDTPPLPAFRMEKHFPCFTIRELDPDDQEFLWEMLYQSLHVPKGQAPFDRKVLKEANLAKYASNWGHEHDTGFMALAKNQMPLGAVWLRMLVGNDKGFGYIDESTPEIGMAVVPDYRGQGIGTSLLARMIERATGRYKQLCLSVTEENPALRLYERFGFEVIARSESTITMRLRLQQKPDR